MKKFLLILSVISLNACTPQAEENDNTQEPILSKNVSYFMQNPEELKKELERCRLIPITKQDEQCAMAQEANRKIAAKKTLDSVKHRAF